MLKKSLVLLALLISACSGQMAPQGTIQGADSEDQGIVGAEKIDKSDVAYKASVMFTDDEGSFCSGTLIGKRIVLTAAHCFKGYLDLIDQYKANFPGASNKKIQVADVIYHPDYKVVQQPTGDGHEKQIFTADLSVVLLKEDAPATAKIIKLNKSSLGLGKCKVRVYGSGFTAGRKGDSGIMRMANLTGIVSSDRPSDITFIQKGGKGVCNGDSGAGLISFSKTGEPLLVGTVSGATDYEVDSKGKVIGDICKAPSVAPQVAPYLPWITKTIAEIQRTND